MTDDRRLQLLLVAFSFGAFFEGASGFGTPVAVTGAILMGLGFTPLAASGLSLIANTAPVAFGALGTPIIALQSVTGLDLLQLSAMVGRQLPVFSLIVPFWLVWAFAGFRGMLGVWPAILVAGVAFAVPAVPRLELPRPVAGRRRRRGHVDGGARRVPQGVEAGPRVAAGHRRAGRRRRGAALVRAGAARVDAVADPQRAGVRRGACRRPRRGSTACRSRASRCPGCTISSSACRRSSPTARPEPAIYVVNWLSATGTGIFLASIVAGLVMRCSLGEMVRTYWRTLKLVKFSLLTISAMMAVGFTTRYSGLDATLGLAFAQTGVLYPFFGAMLGWLGVALTGSDTSSNVLFGSLQKITAEQLGLSPTLMAAANSSGGVMGKMIDAQSIVVASTATALVRPRGRRSCATCSSTASRSPPSSASW